MSEFDLFGKPIIKDVLLRDKFIEPPFSILDTKTGNWQRRKREWKKLGIQSEIGRENVKGNNQYKSLDRKTMSESVKKISDIGKTASIFDPALCEIMYHWFCPENGEILDCFAGGSVRGIVANKLGYNYTGIDIRLEQIESNREQALEILPVANQPNWYVGDSNVVLNDFNKKFDMLFSCPPYGFLEKYSDLSGDISNMDYETFLQSYESIIAKSCNLLKSGSFACFVVGEFRDKHGNYVGFVPDTIKIFQKLKMKFYNEAILLNAIASASMRANNTMKHKKLVKIHQNILIFKKP